MRASSARPAREAGLAGLSKLNSVRDVEVDVDLGELGSRTAGAINEPSSHRSNSSGIPRKEVIQPQLPLRLPCYDFTPIIDHTLGAYLLAVSTATSGTTNFHGVTGGVYKARERIHRGILIRDY